MHWVSHRDGFRSRWIAGLAVDPGIRPGGGLSVGGTAGKRVRVVDTRAGWSGEPGRVPKPCGGSSPASGSRRS